MPGGPLEVGYGVSYLSIAIPVRYVAYRMPPARCATVCLQMAVPLLPLFAFFSLVLAK